MTHAGVTGIRVEGDRVRGVHSTRGDVDADAVVVAAGPFTAQVGGTGRRQRRAAPDPPQKLVIPELPAVPADAPMTIEEETAAHWRPAMRGCLALFTDPDTPPSEPHDPVPIEPDWAFGLLDPSSGHALSRVAPFWRDAWAGGAPTAHWFLQAGQYEYTPDRRPYLGPIGPDGLHLNGGYSGHGIMAGAGGSRRRRRPPHRRGQRATPIRWPPTAPSTIESTTSSDRPSCRGCAKCRRGRHLTQRSRAL